MTPDKNTISCNFCGVTQKQASKLLAGLDGVHICEKCVQLSSEVLEKQFKKKEASEKKKMLRRIFETPAPKTIHKELNEHVIGQDQVKKSVSVAVYNHCKRIFNETDVPIQKSNVLLLGPTGVGKTLIGQTLAAFLGVPFVITDATTITESGYAGDDAEVLIHKLFQNSNYDIDRTEIGIIYVDEIDKKAKRNDLMSLSRDVSGEGVQQSLLKLMEGTVIKVPNKPGRNPETVEIDTSNILFIVGGAFVGLREVVQQRLGKHKIGFKENVVEDPNEWEKYLETRDIVSYGLIPEFMGRLPTVGVLRELSRKDLLRVLTEPKNSLVKQYQALFKIDGIELTFQNSALDKVVDIALEQDLGARGLRKILDNALVDIQYDLPDYVEDGISKILITPEVIAYNKKPLTVKGDMIAK